MYNMVYSKKALNIYTFAFVHEHVETNKEQKIKDLLCATYLHVSKTNNENKIISLKNFILEIENIESLDETLINDESINTMYKLLPIHEQLKISDIKQEYIEALNTMKEEFAEIDVAELKKFLTIIDELDELYEKISDNEIAVEELQRIDAEVEEKLDYLAIYLPKQKIDLYKTYFNAKNGDLDSSLARYAASLLDSYKGEMTFSELLQVDFITDKVACASKISKFDDIELNEEEQKNIKKYAGVKLVEMLLIVTVLGIFLFSFCNSFIQTNQNTYLIPISILVVVTLLSAVNLIKYIILLFRNNKILKGGIGFVGSMELDGAKGGCKYKLYLPKYDEKCSVLHKRVLGDKGILTVRRTLKLGTMVKYVKVLGFKFVIPQK